MHDAFILSWRELSLFEEWYIKKLNFASGVVLGWESVKGKQWSPILRLINHSLHTICLLAQILYVVSIKLGKNCIKIYWSWIKKNSVEIKHLG